MSEDLLDHRLDHLTAKGGESPAGDGWLITFADLLTLILCFFVATMRLGPIGRGALGEDPPAPNRRADQPASQTAGPTAVGGGQDGIPIAKLIEKPAVSEFRIRAEEFDGSGGGIRIELLERVKSAVSALDYVKKTIRIQTCGEAEFDDAGPQWFAALGRVSALRSQLLDAAGSKARVELQVFGPHCDQIRRGKEGDTAVAVVRVTNEFERHG